MGSVYIYVRCASSFWSEVPYLASTQSCKEDFQLFSHSLWLNCPKKTSRLLNREKSSPLLKRVLSFSRSLLLTFLRRTFGDTCSSEGRSCLGFSFLCSQSCSDSSERAQRWTDAPVFCTISWFSGRHSIWRVRNSWKKLHDCAVFVLILTSCVQHVILTSPCRPCRPLMLAAHERKKTETSSSNNNNYNSSNIIIII